MNKTKKDKSEYVIGVNNYVDHSMSILERIHELLEKKFDGKQIELAKKLGKKESEISKWLNGVQNFTLFTISRLEEAFGEKIIGVCTDSLDSTFVQVKLNECTPYSSLELEINGTLTESTSTYKEFHTNTINATSKKEVIAL